MMPSDPKSVHRGELAERRRLSALQRLAAEHRLKSGDHVVRLRFTSEDGSLATLLYRYTTAAAQVADHMKANGVGAEIDLVRWDGIEQVGFDCGD